MLLARLGRNAAGLPGAGAGVGAAALPWATHNKCKQAKFVLSFVRLFAYSLIRLFTRSFVHLFVCSFAVGQKANAARSSRSQAKRCQ